MKIPKPEDMLGASLEAGWMMAEAHWVITLRMAGMAGLWAMRKGETDRMLSEKMSAGQDSVAAAMKVGMAGGTPGEVALAALKPLRRRTRANARRLTLQAGGRK